MACCGDNFSEIDREEDPGSFGGIKRNRSCTDTPVLITMGAFFVVLIALLGYCMANGDIDRFVNGYDDCGNVCGKNNKKTDSIPFECFGKDMAEKKYLLTTYVRGNTDFNYSTKDCVENCASHGARVEFLNRCFPSVNTSGIHTTNKGFGDVFQEISEDFQMCWKNIILLTFLAMVFSIMMMVLLRYATAFVVWFVLIGITALLIGGTIFLWILYKNANDAYNASVNSGIIDFNKENDKNVFLYGAIIATIFCVVILLVIICMAKRIKLVIQLFKEAAKAIAAMPQMLFQPVLTFIALFVILFCGFYFSVWLMSSGNLQKITPDDAKIHHENPDGLEYYTSGVALFTSWYNYFGILWMIQFVVGCQHMIISGCVATWFFARDKDNLGSPIITSTMNLLKYHLGTIAFGSLIITLVQILKAIISSIKGSLNDKKSFIACLMDFCLRYVLEWIEALLKFFSRNAYIQTAIYGHSFCYGGKRAFKMLMNNIFKVVAINSVGDFVLFFTKVFIVIATVFVGVEVFRKNEQLHHLWFPLVLVGLISYFIAHCFVTVFEMAIDTIFLCFCEDCEQNDGLSKPYYMSRNLMEFVEKSNKVLNSKNWDNTDQQAWDNGPKRLLQQGS